RSHRPEDPHRMSELALGMERRRLRLHVPAAWRQPLAVAGVVIAAAWIVIAIFAPLIAPYKPLALVTATAEGPSLHHVFGTDELGRDVFSRVVYGARVANPILLLSGLSFLGLGAQPPKAEWGSMVAEGTQYFQWWWIGTFPGLAIFTVVLAFNFLGDSLRDVFDPRTARRSEGETQ